jgi:hypothetical protein
MIEAIRSATSCHVSQYLVDEPINNVALTPSSSLSGAFTSQYVAHDGLLYAFRTANNLTGHSFSCKTALNCCKLTSRQAAATGLRVGCFFRTDAVLLHESAILLTMEIQGCDCAVHDCSFDAMDHAFSSQGTTLSSPSSNQLLGLHEQSRLSNSKQYISSSQMSVTSPISPPSG